MVITFGDRILVLSEEISPVQRELLEAEAVRISAQAATQAHQQQKAQEKIALSKIRRGSPNA